MPGARARADRTDRIERRGARICAPSDQRLEQCADANAFASARRARLARPRGAERGRSSAIRMLGAQLGRDFDRIAAGVWRQRFEGNLVGPSSRVLVHLVIRVIGCGSWRMRKLSRTSGHGSVPSEPSSLDLERGAESTRVMRPICSSFGVCVAASRRECLDLGGRLPMVRLWVGRAALCRRMPPDLRSVMGSSLLV